MLNRPSDPHEHLMTLITRHQEALRGYIQALMPGEPGLVDDVLQETNLTIWRKADEFDESRSFMPWACRIAHFQVKSLWRDAKRDRHVFHSDLIDQLAEEEFGDEEETRLLDRALHECLSQLPADKRQLILERYQPDGSVMRMAEARGQSPNAISLELHRIRHLLETCVERKMWNPSK